MWNRLIKKVHRIHRIRVCELFVVQTGLRLVLVSLCLTVCVTGCQTKQSAKKPPQEVSEKSELVLREGDTVRVAFPASPELTKVQQIRRDGMVTLPLIGEFKAAGLTPVEMQNQLLKLYEPQLQNKEILVSVDSAALNIYVTGAVLRPGRVASDHPMTALEAVLEAGIDYTKADLKKVTVIRQEGGHTQHYVLNLKQVLQHGEQNTPFGLRPSDIVYVPERFVWF
jgi:polysaccharide export outer membrane protein